MDLYSLDLLKIVFLFGFSLHNIEEAIWLPKWSKQAGRFHKPMETIPFIFAVVVVTMIGYVLTVLDILMGDSGSLVNYSYLGFVGMMGLNTIFPHLAATIVTKKYTPGLLTGLFINLPLSVILLWLHLMQGIRIDYLLLSILAVSGLVFLSLRHLFRIGGALSDFLKGKP